MIKSKFLLTFLFLGIFFQVYAQFQANYWYFGNFNGIQFTNGYAEHMTNGQLKTEEGCATISDSLGNLLFYTNGKHLYGKNHQLITNQLIGNPDATQSSIFIPYPFYEDTILLFVNGAYGNGGVYYYLLSASQQTILNGPYLLYQPTCEKLTAVHQINRKDFWLLTHEWNSNRFVCFSITDQGISNPIFSAVGTSHTGTSIIASGSMKFSLQGDQVACAIPYLNLVERFDFQNGILFNPRQKSIRNPYGLSFSPNGQILYATGYYFDVGGTLVNEVFQWNNQNQLVTVGSWSSPLFTPEIWIGDISNAIDGKIYIAKKNAQSLAVIEKPNLNGNACNFQLNGFPTPNFIVQYGLPNFVQSFVIVPELNFQIPSSVCSTDSFNICANSNLAGNFEWTMNNQSFSTPWNCIKYAFSFPGEYIITLKQQGYQVSKKIKVYGKPKNPFLQPILYACKGDIIHLDAQNPGASYFWSNGMSNRIISIERSGQYNVKIFFDAGKCIETFSVQVIFIDPPEYDFQDTLVCYQDDITYANPFHDAQTLWNGNILADTFRIYQSGMYTVTFSRMGICEWKDTFKVSISPTSPKSLPDEISFCPFQSSIVLNAGSAVSYLWNTNDTTSTIEIHQPGIYTVTKTDKNGCITTEQVEVKSKCHSIFMPNAFTPNQDGKNETLKPISEELSEYEMCIYNYAGKLIFKGLEWNGENASEGVYIVFIQGKWKDGKDFHEIYNVTLIR